MRKPSKKEPTLCQLMHGVIQEEIDNAIVKGLRETMITGKPPKNTVVYPMKITDKETLWSKWREE